MVVLWGSRTARGHCIFLYVLFLPKQTAIAELRQVHGEICITQILDWDCDFSMADFNVDPSAGSMTKSSGVVDDPTNQGVPEVEM